MLEMGEPVRIVDLARKDPPWPARGPDVDIAYRVHGARPGREIILNSPNATWRMPLRRPRTGSSAVPAPGAPSGRAHRSAELEQMVASGDETHLSPARVVELVAGAEGRPGRARRLVLRMTAVAPTLTSNLPPSWGTPDRGDRLFVGLAALRRLVSWPFSCFQQSRDVRLGCGSGRDVCWKRAKEAAEWAWLAACAARKPESEGPGGSRRGGPRSRTGAQSRTQAFDRHLPIDGRIPGRVLAAGLLGGRRAHQRLRPGSVSAANRQGRRQRAQAAKQDEKPKCRGAERHAETTQVARCPGPRRQGCE